MNLYNFVVNFVGEVPIEYDFIYVIITLLICFLVICFLFNIFYIPFKLFK